jgi:hypothetical protein
MPQLGESVTEGTVTRWLKAVGDTVTADEPLLEVSTDKVDTEIPSPVAVRLLLLRSLVAQPLLLRPHLNQLLPLLLPLPRSPKFLPQAQVLLPQQVVALSRQLYCLHWVRVLLKEPLLVG